MNPFPEILDPPLCSILVTSVVARLATFGGVRQCIPRSDAVKRGIYYSNHQHERW